MPFKHGIIVTEVTNGARTLTALSTAIIGLVAIASDADAAAVPLNRPALVTDVETAIGKAGVAGTLAKSLRAIADQCRPIIVVVRVEEGDDAAETAANVIGTTTAEGQKTGMQALLAAQGQLNVRPRILGTPVWKRRLSPRRWRSWRRSCAALPMPARSAQMSRRPPPTAPTSPRVN